MHKVILRRALRKKPVTLRNFSATTIYSLRNRLHKNDEICHHVCYRTISIRLYIADIRYYVELFSPKLGHSDIGLNFDIGYQID
jgi:hypothetical protein